ncbi:hypothetical protein [uncultured Desulfobulbus sp.]|uniref:hypothetical protein n=1 Tax=uncultured Desulfobulbus sp. TaxID=239745 RepID=UPI0029C77AA4|nr:hypothetical protein [uncultured Desulfobulbus sp.]
MRDRTNSRGKKDNQATLKDQIEIIKTILVSFGRKVRKSCSTGSRIELPKRWAPFFGEHAIGLALFGFAAVMLFFLKNCG